MAGRASQLARLALLVLLVWPAVSFGHVPMPTEPVLIHAGDCPWLEEDVAGCYRSPYLDPFAEIFIQDSESAVLWHELGHSFDHADMTDRDRDRFRFALRADRPWSQLQEVFADQYAACAMHEKLPDFAAWQHRGACRVIWAAAR